MTFITLPSWGVEPVTAADLQAMVNATSELRPVFKRKTSDETVNNSATLQNDDHLFLSVAASTTYELDGVLHYNSGTTPDFKFGWTVPTGLTMKYTVQAVSGSFNGFSQDQTTIPAIDGQGVDVAAVLTGIVIVSTTAGTLTLQWAQNTANASNTIVRAGSYLRLRKVE